MKKILFICAILLAGAVGYIFFRPNHLLNHFLSEGENFDFPLDMEPVALDMSRLKGVHQNPNGHAESEIYAQPQELVDELQFPITLPAYFTQGEYGAKITDENPIAQLLIALPEELSSPQLPSHPYMKITLCTEKRNPPISTEYMGLFEQVPTTLTKPQGLTILRSGTDKDKGSYYGIWKDAHFLYEVKDISSQEELEKIISSSAQ